MLVTVFVAALLGLSASQANEQTFITEETIAFVSTRDHTLDLPPILGAEIYLIKADGTNLRR